MDIGIAGVGVVGGALARWLGENTQNKIKLFDPGKGLKDSLKHCDATFICTPCPTKDDGDQDYGAIEESIERSSGIKFIRSTVLPGTNDRLGTYSCPEFLTERTAYRDTCEMQIIAGYLGHDFMRRIFPGKTFTLMSNNECEIAKYAHNAFGAVKVNFFNLIYNLCELRGCDYERVKDAFLMSGYINQPHTAVPGPDGRFGYGGACFPKDLKAFNNFYPTKTFQSCIDENKSQRGTDKSASS